MHCINCCREPRRAFTCMDFFPIRCGGLCAAHGIVPECIQNRGSKKHIIFIEFGVDFSSFFDSPTLKFCAHSQCFVRIFYFSLFLIWRRFWSRKTSQKRLRNHPETMKKSMLKACCFSTSIFERSGLDLGASRASKMEPSWPKMASQRFTLAPLERS